MMTALLLHGYASGVYSSRRIAKAAVERSAGRPRQCVKFTARQCAEFAGLEFIVTG